MKSLIDVIACLCFLFLSVADLNAAQFDDVGLVSLTAIVPERNDRISLSVFYPSKDGGSIEEYGSSKIFKGITTRRDAFLPEGKFPVIILAHGGLRANPTLSGWVAADLAARGNVVVVVHPPQLAVNDAQSAVAEIWLRPSDLSAALDAIEANPVFSPHINTQKVATVGFFLGGTSALMIAGARLDSEGYRSSCDDIDAGPDCKWFAKAGVDLHQVDAALISASHVDPRFRTSIIIDPELSDIFTAESLKSIGIKVHLITLGKENLPQLSLKEKIPNIDYSSIPDASRFSVFSECTQQAATLLSEEGDDDTICQDGGIRSRATIQSEIGDIIGRSIMSGLE